LDERILTMGTTAKPAVATGALHHLQLIVSDLERACSFYIGVLGFQVVATLPSGVMLSNGAIMLGLGRAPRPEQASEGERFDENRIGLGHLALRVAAREVLEQATHLLDDRGLPHGEIRDLGPGLGSYTLSLHDPDNIQLELMAPYP
jgi:glyoxylase I family protein